jgi:hypothetical protein
MRHCILLHFDVHEIAVEVFKRTREKIVLVSAIKKERVLVADRHWGPTLNEQPRDDDGTQSRQS